MENTSYEMMFILAPDLGEQETQKEIEEVKTLIAENEGEITDEDIWGIREFTYRMKGFEQGYYVVFNLNMPPEKLNELEKPMNINKNLLRFLLIKTPKNYAMKKMEEYELQWAKEDEEKEKEKAKKKTEGKKPEKKEAPKKVVKKKIEEKIEETPKKTKVMFESEVEREEPEKETGKKEQVEEMKEEKPETKLDEEKTKESKRKLDEVDEKLKSIINDPDISL